MHLLLQHSEDDETLDLVSRCLYLTARNGVQLKCVGLNSAVTETSKLHAPE